MNDETAATRAAGSSRLKQLLLAIAVLALVAYFLWPRLGTVLGFTGNTPAVDPAAASATQGAAADAAYTGPGSPGYQPIPPPPMALDENGGRILNEAGLPPGPPLPEAKPLPVQAKPGEVIGYTVDEQGKAQPLRAGELKAVPNSPGTYAVVDMWADGGYVVVPPTPVQRLTESELKQLREAEAKRDGRTRPTPPN